jgi:hypothetical protein
MATAKVVICPGEIVAAPDVIVTVGATPPEWQPLHPSDAMPFLCASALAEARSSVIPLASASPK